jgi:glucose/arabinose dehydrogenase
VAGEPGNPNRVYVVEAEGTIQLVENGVTNSTPFLDISSLVCTSAEGCGFEGGMTSMAFAPDYATSGLFYVFFTRDATPQHDLVIREFQRTSDANDIDEGTGRDVLVIPHPDDETHNGGQLQFGPDGLLYISTGDGGSTPEKGQDLDTLLGKLLRIDPRDPPGGSDYSVPPGNPFVGVAGDDEIYSYGLRNPYRFSFDRLTGDLTIADVGQASWEEVDFMANGAARGANFGWRCFEANHTFHTGDECDPLPSNHTPPVLEYENPPGPPNAAVNGGFVIRDTTVPSLLGRYVYADTYGARGNQIHSAQLFPGGSSGDASTGMTANFVVSFGEDACGHVYVAHDGDTVSRIQQSGATPACAPQLAATGAADTRGPSLSFKLRKARRAAARGEVTLGVTCDETCKALGEGEIVMRGRDMELDPDGVALAAGARGALHLDLSRREAKRLLRALSGGGKAKAAVEVTATDLAGNQAAAERRIRQKP